MVYPFNIPVMINSETKNPALRCSDEMTKRDILVHWSQVDLTEAIKYHQDTNQYAYEEGMGRSDWIKDLMMNSSEAELKERVDEKFEKIELLKQGGITYLEFMLNKMFCMTNDVISALQTFLNNLAEEGLLKTVGDNVS